MRNDRLGVVLVAAMMFSLSWPAQAQWQVGPVYPQKEQPPYVGNPPPSGPNYNPFWYNPHSGRFDYVPIPYEPQRPGPNYDPFRFNWHSGRWDYVPWGPPFDYNDWARQHNGGDWGTASNHRDTRLYRRPPLNLQPPPDMLSSHASRSSEGAVAADPLAASGSQPPAPAMPAMVLPQATTRRSAADVQGNRAAGQADAAGAATSRAARAATSPATPEGWVRMRGIVGRWEYDYANGRWIFVLPSD